MANTLVGNQPLAGLLRGTSTGVLFTNLGPYPVRVRQLSLVNTSSAGNNVTVWVYYPDGQFDALIKQSLIDGGGVELLTDLGVLQPGESLKGRASLANLICWRANIEAV